MDRPTAFVLKGLTTFSILFREWTLLTRKKGFFTVAESVLQYMVHKPILRFVITPVAAAGILMLAILAATANAQENNNTGNAQQQGNSTENSQQSNNAGNGQENNNAGNGQENNATPPSVSATNNATSPSVPTASNNTGNASADFVNSILAVHNRERAAVGVQPLVWNNTLAAGAKAWAENLAATGKFEHSTCCGAFRDYGENLAGFDPSQGVSAPGGGLMLWVAEKNNYHGGPITPDIPANQTIGHYTQMVWRNTTSVGCGIGSGSGHPFSILVCRYYPPGNIFGQKPY
ncbi:MAG: CAP domain-containing protein [Candidatus Nitrosopolaris sp.]